MYTLDIRRPQVVRAAKTRLTKWGNSLAVRIPARYASELGLTADCPLEMVLMDGTIVIRRLGPTLDELLAQVKPECLHEETDFGGSVGHEEW